MSAQPTQYGVTPPRHDMSQGNSLALDAENSLTAQVRQSYCDGFGSDTGRMPDTETALRFQRAQEPMDDMENELEKTEVAQLCAEDAESLIALSISEAASRLKPIDAPVNEDIPTLEDSSDEYTDASEGLTQHVRKRLISQSENDRKYEDRTFSSSGQTSPLSLKILCSPRTEPADLPTPWNSHPKIFVNRQADTSQPLLLGGTDSLKRFLPSMAQVSNYFGSTNNSKFKFSLPPSFSRDNEAGPASRPKSMSLSGLAYPESTSQPQIFDQAVGSQSVNAAAYLDISTTFARPKSVRRVTSDDSLLYHSLSRASSLGDDARFKNHRDQVNSRMKALRDSIQDRSSFRMPQMPSMPNLPSIPSLSGFNFNINFLNSAISVPDVLPRGTTLRRSTISELAVAPGLVGASLTRPEAVSKTTRLEGPHDSYLDRAIGILTGDVVIMGGYRGSILRSTRTNRQLWIPVKVGLNIRKVDLEVGLEPQDEERMPETIYPSGMLQNIGPVDISKRLFKRLSECENARNGTLRIWDYGYDWRLSPHLLSRQLTEFLEKLPSNQPAENGLSKSHGALVIAHSLGGLITRHVANHRPELLSGVIYAGVPQACVNILGPIRNGDSVLLSSRVLTAQVNFTLRTSFLLLPEDGRCFVDQYTQEQYHVDFFNVEDWVKYRLSPCIDAPLPPRNQQVGGLGSILNISGSLLNLPIPGKKSSSRTSIPLPPNEGEAALSSPSKTSRAADVIQVIVEGGTNRKVVPQISSGKNAVSKGQNTNQAVSTAVTIPRCKALAYLERTLTEIKKFKKELHFKPELSSSNRYPPIALIYGKSIPTVHGAKVDGREGIARSDCYNNLAFASGDGVCLAKEAMLPSGYQTVYGGRISSERGHVTLLGDLNAVGKAIDAVMRGRKKGIGSGNLSH